MKCREIWIRRYPNEPFENEADSDSNSELRVLEVADEEAELLEQVKKNRFLYSKFLEPYRSEIVYLIAARQRYKRFLFMVQRSSIDLDSPLVPASDIMLMWLTHQVLHLFQFCLISLFILLVSSQVNFFHRHPVAGKFFSCVCETSYM